jgi:hypothetical protein
MLFSVTLVFYALSNDYAAMSRGNNHFNTAFLCKMLQKVSFYAATERFICNFARE